MTEKFRFAASQNRMTKIKPMSEKKGLKENKTSSFFIREESLRIINEGGSSIREEVPVGDKNQSSD
jgi:hypothetical protein